jgi:protein involved in polysaccharide export with SLBB domain
MFLSLRIVAASLFLLVFSSTHLLCGCTAFLDEITFRGGEEPGVDENAVYQEDGDPKIRPGLFLRIGVTASGAVTVEEVVKEVDLKGEIVLPMIGAVKCEGLTVVALQEQIKEAYKKYFIDPQVSVSFVYDERSGMKSPWGSVLVMGSVQRPGPVNMPATRELSVTQALLVAGNPTPLANKSRVRVTRRNKDGTLKRYIIDVVAIGQKGRAELDMNLKSGDVVYVPETWY